MMGNWGYGGYGMMGGFGWIGMILFWILLVLAIVWLWRTLDIGANLRGSGPKVEGKNAIDIVKERYAKGEITKDEFEQLKKDLA